MSAVDLSDLPIPGGPDISDLPVPPVSRGWGQALEEEALAGVHGAEREGLGLSNVVTKHVPLVPTYPSDETLSDLDTQHAGEFAQNKAGKLIGEAAPWLATQLVPGLGEAEDVGGFVGGLSRTLKAIGPGGIQGAATASPEDQGKAAALGALTSGAMSGTGSALARGVVAKSPGAQAIADASDGEAFIPISQGADNGAVRGFYKSVLPFALGAGAQLKKQAGQWGSAFKEAVAPAYDAIMSRWSTKGLPYSPSTGQTVDPSDLEQAILERIRTEEPTMPNSMASEAAGTARSILADKLDNPSGTVGPAIQNAYTALGSALRGAGGQRKVAYGIARSVLDDVRKGGLSPEDQAALTDLDTAYSSIPEVSANKAKLHQLAGYAELGAAASGAPHVLLPLAVANALATKTAQRGLYGDLGVQQGVRNLASSFPLTTRLLGTGARSAAVGAETNSGD